MLRKSIEDRRRTCDHIHMRALYSTCQSSDGTPLRIRWQNKRLFICKHCTEVDHGGDKRKLIHTQVDLPCITGDSLHVCIRHGICSRSENNVPQHRALRLSRTAGGIVDRCLIPTLYLRKLCLRYLLRTKQPAAGFVRHGIHGLCVLLNKFQPFLRPVRIRCHIGGSCIEDPEKGKDGIRRMVHGKKHPVFLFYALRQKPPGNVLRSGNKLPIGQRLLTADQRNTLTVPALIEQMQYGGKLFFLHGLILFHDASKLIDKLL